MCCWVSPPLYRRHILLVLKESHKALVAQTMAAQTNRCTVRLQIVNPLIRSHTRSMYINTINIQGLSSVVYLTMRRKYAPILIPGAAREWNRVKSEGWRGMVSLCAISCESISPYQVSFPMHYHIPTRLNKSSGSASKKWPGNWRCWFGDGLVVIDWGEDMCPSLLV